MEVIELMEKIKVLQVQLGMIRELCERLLEERASLQEQVLILKSKCSAAEQQILLKDII